jgi:hypothetical protein
LHLSKIVSNIHSSATHCCTENEPDGANGKLISYITDRAEELIQKWAMCGEYKRTTSEEELAGRYHIPISP